MSEKLICEACGTLFDPEDKVIVELPDTDEEMIICQECGRTLMQFLVDQMQKKEQRQEEDEE